MSSVCRVCLAGNKLLKSLNNKLLVDLYEKLSTIKFNSEDARPKAVCSSCYQKLLRCHTFSQMAHRSEKIFTLLFHEGLEATQANITEMTTNNCQSSVVPMQFTTIDDETTNAATQVPIKDEPISSIDLKEEITENETLVEIDSAQDCIQSHFKLEDKSGLGNETEELPFIVQDEQTKPDGSRSLMEPSSSNEFHEQFNQNDHLVEHRHIHTRKKSFACNVCDKPFYHKCHLVRHMRIHTGEKPFVCKVCDKQYAQKSSLVFHTRMHTGEKPFVCNVCDKQFIRKSYLEFHTNMHTGEKPFTCSVCDKQFNRKYNLTEHMRLHTGERPFVCNGCGKQFHRKKYLVGHMRIHTGEKPFACNVCHKKYSRKSRLVKHIENHRGEKPAQTQHF